MMAIMKCLLVALLVCCIEAKSSRLYTLPGQYCGRSPKEIDGAMINSSYDPLYANSACVLKFMSDDDRYTSKRIMMRFDRLNFTRCEGTKLSVYFDRDSFGGPDYEYDCSNTLPAVIYSTGKYLTLRLDKMGSKGTTKFGIVLTTFKDTSFCSDYQCGENNGHCIDDDLFCDGIPNCINGRDEFNCTMVDIESLKQIGYTFIIGSLVVTLLICGGCGALIYFLCRRRRSSSGTVIRTQPPMNMNEQQQPMMQQQQNYPTQPMYPPAQPAYGPAYPPQQPQYPPQYPQQQYGPPPPGAYPSAPPPGYGEQSSGPYAPPPPFNEQVNYNANQEKVHM